MQVAALREVLDHLLATHAAFAAFRFPLPPVAATRTFLPSLPSRPPAAASRCGEHLHAEAQAGTFVPSRPAPAASGDGAAAASGAAVQHASAQASSRAPGARCGEHLHAEAQAGGASATAATPTAQAAAAAAAQAAVVPAPAGSRECALVAALWPLLETELHAVLKELIRLHGQVLIAC